MKETKEQLGELNKQIFDNASLSIITIDIDGYITSANEYYKNLSKKAEHNHHNIFEGEFFIRENLVDEYRKLLATGTIVRREKCYEKNSKGEDKYLKIIAVPLRDKDGGIIGALSMAEDITDAVIYKNSLEYLNMKLEDKVHQRTAKLREANEELDKVLNLKSIFLADVSHELRTALTIIQGNLELMSQGQFASEDDAESYDQIFKEIKRMLAMLTSLMMLSNSNSSDQKLNYEKINLTDLIISTVKSLRVVGNEKNTVIGYKNSEADMEIMADKDKLEKLMINLIKNAIHYNKKNGWIDIEAEKTENEIIISVRDGGIGIPEEHLANIFERFYRVDKSRSRSEGGSGLGLAICKWVAEAHGGKIDVSSEVGKGTQFAVHLPRTDKNIDKILKTEYKDKSKE